MKKFITAFLLQCLLFSYAANTFAAASSVYTENFDSGTIKSDMSLKNANNYSTGFTDGFAGKPAGDKSLAFARETSASDSGIYTQVYTPTTMKYIKYELNFVPNSEAFSNIIFKTGANKNISPAIYCNDDGSGQYYLLNRNAWNKIVYIIMPSTTVVDKTKRDIACKIDLFINGKQICKNADYTLYKDNNTSTYAPIRLLITGNGKADGESLFPALTTYIDDIDICRYDAYPEIKVMPQLVSSDNANVTGNEYRIYRNAAVKNIVCPENCEITVFGNSNYTNPLSQDSLLSENDLIAVRDAYNQINYYTVKEKAINRADITAQAGKITATANLDNAVLLLAGYAKSGALASVNISTVHSGKADATVTGSFAAAKAFIFDSLTGIKPLAPAAEYTKMPTVACWGDSLTEGQGSTDFRNGGTFAYPGVLKSLTGLEVYNMGSSGETAMSIAARQGAINVLLENDITIPAGCTPVRVEFKGYNADGTLAGTVTPRNSKDWNPCVINGIEGKLTFKVNTSVNPRVLKWAEFTRNVPGDSVLAAKGSQLLMPNNSEVAENADINVIFIGTNGVWNANDASGEGYADDLVILINKMLAKTKNPDKYIVIGLTTGDKNRWTKTDAALKAAYKEHLILPKERLATEQVLTDNNITPTEQDIADLEQGRIPTSLRLAANDVHFNDTGYAELAKLVYKKMLELGYCEN